MKELKGRGGERKGKSKQSYEGENLAFTRGSEYLALNFIHSFSQSTNSFQ